MAHTINFRQRGRAPELDAGTFALCRARLKIGPDGQRFSIRTELAFTPRLGIIESRHLQLRGDMPECEALFDRDRERPSIGREATHVSREAVPAKNT